MTVVDRPMGKIIWLASFPKSGNTWVRVFLHNLLQNPASSVDINRISEHTLAEASIEHYRPFDPRPPEAWSLEETAKVRLQVHEVLTRRVPDDVFVKIHGALAVDHGHPTVNLGVTAGTIYIVRNPLDIVPSFADHMGISIDQAIESLARTNAHTETKGKYVAELRGSWSQHVESWTERPHPSLYLLRYEDMIEQPSATFGGLARFLGLAPSADRLRRAIAMSAFPVLREQERHHGFRERSPHAERFFRGGRAGQWRETLRPDQIAAIVATHRAQMARFGYVPEDY
ncbi:MAG: sulfotransferase domain-containing protein [Alphaproteobacteria bacterium]